MSTLILTVSVIEIKQIAKKGRMGDLVFYLTLTGIALGLASLYALCPQMSIAELFIKSFGISY
jgi:hypothetical protein